MKLTGEKIEKLTSAMQQEGVDAAVIGPSGDMRYLIGFAPHACERFQALFVLSDARIFYVANLLYYEDLKEVLPSNTAFYLWKDAESFIPCLQRAFQDFDLSGKTLAINGSINAVDLIEMEAHLRFASVAGRELLENYRAVKSWDNISQMRQAAEIADDVLEEVVSLIRPGVSEADIQSKIIELFAEKGADETVFAIVASGSHNSKPHYNRNDRIITDPDVVLIDYGCKLNGYCSDTTRTFFVGEVDDEKRQLYEIVKKARQAAFDFVREGVTAGEVDRKAREVIENAGYGEYFFTRTGHGIGCDVHEAPYIRGNNQQVLEKGMAFSIEPGIYIAGQVGIRIEDVVIINEDGECESLSHFSRELTVL